MIEEKAINHAKQLDLIHSQSSTLYDLISNASHPSNAILTRSRIYAASMVGSVIAQNVRQLTVASTKFSPSPTKSFKVNTIQFNSSQQLEGKNTKKGKSNYSSTPQEIAKTQQTIVETSLKQKAKFPFFICGQEHHTKEFPCDAEVTKLLKGTNQSTVLTNPFPPYQMVAQNHAPP